MRATAKMNRSHRKHSIPVEWRDCAWRPRIARPFDGRQGWDSRASAPVCGGKRSVTPLWKWTLNPRRTNNLFTLLVESKAVSPPPHSKMASAFHDFPGASILQTYENYENQNDKS